MGEFQKETLVQQIFTELETEYDEVIQWRRHLHQHPELSFQEYETAKFIKEKLTGFGLPFQDQVGGNGIVATLTGAQPGKTIALRADFDALPIQDEKDVPYRSKNPGVMHACGHDGHTAALLGTAKVLSRYKDKLKGNIVFIFQHAEETPPGGAKSMVEENVLADVDYVFAAHLASDIPLGKIAVGEGYTMAAVDKFKITIQGKGGHGARPHEAIDSIVIGSEVVHSLQKIVSRKVNPLDSAVVTIGVFQAGSAFNVIADQAVLEGTVRTFSESVRQQIREDIETIVKGITSAYKADYSIDYLFGYPALFNHKEETNTIRSLFEEAFSKENVIEMIPSMGAEDFAYFLLEKPGSYFRVGARNEKEETHFPHHHPRFDFDERALLNIKKSFVKIVSHYLF